MFLSMPSFMLLPSGAERSTINLHFPSLFFFGIILNGLQCMLIHLHCLLFCELNDLVLLASARLPGTPSQQLDPGTACCSLLVAAMPFYVGNQF